MKLHKKGVQFDKRPFFYNCRAFNQTEPRKTITEYNRLIDLLYFRCDNVKGCVDVSPKTETTTTDDHVEGNNGE